MPNRIIKESICSNEQLDQLSPFEETFFYRLIVNADDFGRMDGRPSILRARLFPLKTLRDDQIEKALASLTSVELVSRYTVHGKPFVRLLGWERNQQIRAKKSRYPSPEDADACEHIPASDATCNHLISNDIKCSRNPIQYESESNQNPKGNTARATRFTPPTVDDVQAYCSEQHFAVDAQRFVDYYTANGWMVGKNRMKDWRASLRTWASRDKQPYPAADSKANPALNYNQRSHTDSDYDALFVDLNTYGGDDHGGKH